MIDVLGRFGAAAIENHRQAKVFTPVLQRKTCGKKQPNGEKCKTVMNEKNKKKYVFCPACLEQLKAK